jgi:hypothetical protein
VEEYALSGVCNNCGKRMVHQVLGHNHNTPGPVILLKNFHHVLLTICKFQRIISWLCGDAFFFVVVARARLKKSSVQIFLSPHCMYIGGSELESETYRGRGAGTSRPSCAT